VVHDFSLAALYNLYNAVVTNIKKQIFTNKKVDEHSAHCVSTVHTVHIVSQQTDRYV